MRVKLDELRQGSSLEMYINDFDTLAQRLYLPEQQKIHYFIFGLKPKLKQALLIQQTQEYDDAVTFAKRKHHFKDADSDTQLMDLLQDHDQHFHLPIKPTTSIKLEGLIFHVKTSALCQCLVSGTLDHKPITFLIDKGSSISLFDEQLYWSLSFVPPLQSIQFSVSGADDRHLILLGITSLLIAIDENTFQM